MKNKIQKLFNESSGRRFIFETDMDSVRKVILKDFCLFCKNKLDIKEMPVIKLVARKNNTMSTGSYIPTMNKVNVLAAHRALLDILRSIAHELVHRMQDETGTLKDIGPQGDRGENDKTDVGTWFEDEANAKGGALVKEFSRTYNRIPSNTLYEL
jgi:hypothetical protein